MKAHPEIENPWALAWWMSDKGDASHESAADPGLALISKWEDFEKSPEYQAYMDKHSEANSASALGALERPQKPIESKGTTLQLGVRFLESEGGPNDATREVPVLIIKEGMGNQVDRHFYSGELLARVSGLFNGVKAYADHPSKSEEKDRPERSVREVVGYYHSARIVTIEGKKAIAATLKIIEGAAYEWAWNLVKEAAAFSKKFSDKELVGISINAWGASHAVDGAEGVVNMVDDLTEVQSADIVTQAGAGGGFRIREAVKKALALEADHKEAPMNELLQKHGEALKALHSEMGKNPDHAKAYGPALEALMAHHAEMMKGCEAEPKPGEPKPAEEPAPAEGEPKPQEGQKDEAAKAGETSMEKMREKYLSGKMSADEKVLYEKLSEAEVKEKARAHKELVDRKIAEAKIPAAFAGDIMTLSMGKDEEGVSKLIEARKALVESIFGNRAQGAGAGNGGDKKPSKLSERLAAAGVTLKK